MIAIRRSAAWEASLDGAGWGIGWGTVCGTGWGVNFRWIGRWVGTGLELEWAGLGWIGAGSGLG